MKRSAENGVSVLDLLDQLVHLLRALPGDVWARYLLGNGIYFLALIYFWMDMSRSPFAADRLLPLSGLLAVLYPVHRASQAGFCSALHAVIRDESPQRPSLRQFFRRMKVQVCCAPWSMIFMPISTLLIIPFGWVYAYHQNLVCRNDVDDNGVRDAHEDAKRLSMLWPIQNHYLISLLSLFFFFVVLNVLVAMIMLPGLLKSLLGLHTAFNEGMFWFLNTTFLGGLMMFGYLCSDPFVKAGYVLRCYYGQSVHTGEDLKVAWRQRFQSLAALLILCCGIVFAVVPAGADVPMWTEPAVSEPSSPSSALEADLNQEIDRRSQSARFAWRLPKEDVVVMDEDKSFIYRTAETFGIFLKSVWETLTGWIKDVVDWLDKLFGDRKARNPAEENASGWGGPVTVQVLAWILIAIVVSAFTIAMLRMWRNRSRPVPAEKVSSLTIPDLEDEATLATDLPEDEWLALADQMIAEREYRKALRAYFLAGLAAMDRLGVIEVSRAKSNREYHREAERKSRPFPEVVPAYAGMMNLFEPGWYGDQPVNEGVLQNMLTHVDAIKRHES